MRTSLRVLLSRRQDLQVLWKLRRIGAYDVEGLDEEDVGGRVRVFDWMEADPSLVLQTGQVVCFVHHGGSNSYHEAMGTRTPQVILAAWYDGFESAARAEYFGTGVWGNKHAAPNWTQPELTDALLKTIGSTPDDPVARGYREKAKTLGEIATRGGKNGREFAGKAIWDELQAVLNG